MKRELTIDSDWGSALGMAYLLFVSLFSVVRDSVLLVRGHISQPVTWITVVIAAFAFYLAAALPVRRVFRLAAFTFGLGAAIRALSFYLHASVEAQKAAALAGLVFSLAAFILTSMGAAQWFRTVCRVGRYPETDLR